MEQQRGKPVHTAVVTGDTSFSGLSIFLNEHRNITDHQLVLLTDADSSGGEWKVKYLVDVDGINEAVDTGGTLSLSASSSSQLRFSALLRGILLEEVTAVDSGRSVTVVLSSKPGHLIPGDTDIAVDVSSVAVTEVPASSGIFLMSQNEDILTELRCINKYLAEMLGDTIC